MLLLGLLFGAFQFDGFQSWLARRAASWLSGQLGTTVSIDRVSIRLITSVRLQGVYVEDLQHDTLLYSEEISVGIRDLSTATRKLAVGTLRLTNTHFNLLQYRGEEHDNLHFLLDYFASTDTTPSKPWKLTVERLSLDGVHFRHRIEEDTLSPEGVDFSNLDIDSIYGDLHEIRFSGDSMFTRIEKLRFRDHSGFTLRELSADAKVGPDELRFNSLRIRTPKSSLNLDLSFRFDSFPDFDDFLEKVRWRGDFAASTVSFTDIAFFATDLKGLDREVELAGNFRGTVSKFRGRNVFLGWGRRSVFKGNLSMTGLPEIDETYIDVLAEQIKTDAQDIEWVPVPPFAEKKTVDVPENLEDLGLVDFKGKFTGFFTDFVAYGNMNTDVGYLSADINLKYDNRIRDYVYKGHVSGNQFDIGKIARINEMERVTLAADIDGKGLRFETVDARLDGTIHSLSFKGYAYSNLKVNGEIAKKLFNGTLEIRDANLDMDFEGKINFQGKLPVFDFTSNIRRAHLDPLNLVDITGDNYLSTTIASRLTGNSLDNLTGEIRIDNTSFQVDRKLYRVNRVFLDSRWLDPEQRDLVLESDFLDAHMSGKFQLAQLGDAAKQWLPRYLPSVILPVKTDPGTQDFQFSVRIKNTALLTETFLPSWTIDPNTSISGKMNTKEKTFLLKINSPDLEYGPVGIHGLKTVMSSDVSSLRLDISADTLFVGANDRVVPLVELHASARDNRIDYLLNVSQDDSFPNRMMLAGKMDFISSGKFSLDIDSSALYLENSRWMLKDGNRVAFDSSSIAFQSFELSNGPEAFRVEGALVKDSTHQLRIRMEDFNLRHLDPLLGRTSVGGRMDGDVIGVDLLRHPQMETDLTIRDLSVNGDSLGNATITTRLNSDQKVIVASIGIQRGSAKVADIRGNYYLARETDNLDFKIRLENFYLRTIERYVDDVVSDLNGKLSAELDLRGTFERPVFEGELDFRRAACVVNYLNTRYSFTSRVRVEENAFDLDGMTLVDVNNNEAAVKGKVLHDYFRNFRFDVQLRLRNFQVLNTDPSNNELYYGLANASGLVKITGPLEYLTMDITLAPTKGTVLNIPLTSSSEVTQSTFITFIDPKKRDDFAENTNTIDLSGIRLNMNLEMNPDADINIIFDQKIGDVISGNGNGNLRLDINTVGDFNMYGTYTIEKGTYLFTLQNLINKRFTIDRGGRITWSGNPYEANVDLTAIYTVYTSSLYNLLQDSTYKRRIPVDCKLRMTNRLMNPTIEYEIEPRGLDATAQSLVKTFLNSEQEVSRQMFGLMVLNQFVPQSGGSQGVARLDAGAGAGASASELLSNQVSNWLSQLSKNVNIGFNYRAKDTYSNEEIQLMFSKSLFNDRLLVEGNVGYTGNQAAAAAAGNNSNLVGDFYAEYKLTQDGRFRLKGFNRNNLDNILNYSAPYTQGFGVFFRQEFNDLPDLLTRLRLKHRLETKQLPQE